LLTIDRPYRSGVAWLRASRRRNDRRCDERTAHPSVRSLIAVTKVIVDFSRPWSGVGSVGGLRRPREKTTLGELRCARRTDFGGVL